MKSIAPQQPQPLNFAPQDDSGVDMTLLRWMRSLTPRERLQALQDAVNSMEKLRHAHIPR